jgi:hypothetical protein
MAHIFISYSKQNIDFARHLRAMLQEAGFSVWMDEAQLIASERWWPTIEQSINGCSAFIIIMSPQSKTSDWVEREILFAERLRKPIFPVLLSGESWPRLANIQFADMQAGTESGLPPDLVTGLHRAFAGGGTAPLPSPSIGMSQPRPKRRASPLRRLLLIGGGLLLFVLAVAAVVLNSLNQSSQNTIQSEQTLTSEAQLAAASASQQAGTQAAFSATQQENYLRNLGTQTARAPGALGGCSPPTWFFTFAPGFADMLPYTCPDDAPVFVAAIRQDFQNGYLLWYASTSQHILFPGLNDDVPQVYVISGEGQGNFSIYNDTWTPGEFSFDPDLTPPDGYFQPVDRLGKVWREQPGVRNTLGWATAPEYVVGGRYQLTPGAMCNCVHTYVADGQGNVLDMVQGLTLGSSVATGIWEIAGTYPYQLEN